MTPLAAVVPLAGTLTLPDRLLLLPVCQTLSLLLLKQHHSSLSLQQQASRPRRRTSCLTKMRCLAPRDPR